FFKLRIRQRTSGNDYKKEFENISILKSNGERYAKEIIRFIEQPDFHMNYLNGFFGKLIKQQKFNWVDIEELYYSELKDAHNAGYGTEHINRINEDFEQVKIELEKYLTKVSKRKYRKKTKLGRVFTPNPNSKTIVLTHKKYVKDNGSNIIVVNIHGELNNPQNPIIFGVGDEHHSKYKELSESNENGYLVNIKSIKYLETLNYRKLVSQLNAGDFSVHILGHSCGISDRTLLSEIFNSSTCRNQSIRIYHHNGKNSFIKKTYGISRYFKDNITMRRKVKEFDKNLTI
ncbi:MAG: hypothetical protein HRT73_15545, partial [Flavobacteriales bacterium]|nr:hypothetical protein [Flavobacteriales bacterium]